MHFLDFKEGLIKDMESKEKKKKVCEIKIIGVNTLIYFNMSVIKKSSYSGTVNCPDRLDSRK